MFIWVGMGEFFREYGEKVMRFLNIYFKLVVIGDFRIVIKFIIWT